MTAEAPRRSRAGATLALGQVRHQLLLLIRSPFGFFITLFVPVLLLVCLSLLTPEDVTDVPGGVRYAQWLTPAIVTFCLLNACYVNTITGIVLAREEGILKRLRGTPVPAWTYLVGRFGSVLLTAVLAAGVNVAIATLFFDVTIVWANFGYLLGVAALGIVSFYLVGVAVVSLVPRTETALPVAYGTMLPVAFVSDVFFSSAHSPGWLNALASALPVAPIARGLEAAFVPANTGWPMSVPATLSSLGWSVASLLLIVFTFRWQPRALGTRRWRLRDLVRSGTERRSARRSRGRAPATARAPQRR